MPDLMPQFLHNLSGMPSWLWFLAAAIAMGFAGPGVRRMLLLLAPVMGLLSLLVTPLGDYMPMQLFGLELLPYRVDGLSYPFLLAFNCIALIVSLYALASEQKLQSIGAMLYAAGTIAVVGAGDLLSLIVAWEVMGLSSVALIFANHKNENISVGLNYLMYQLLSGFLLICGVTGIVHLTGDLRFDYIGVEHISGLLVFFAFGIKCGFPLLHNWIVNGYPAASISGTVLLGAFTTKAAVYAMARAFPGTEELIYIGVAMACLPIFYAMLENDLRRVLAYSIINQIGFMLCGIGTGLAIGINGAVAHAVNDIFFKGLLFMSIGAVLYVTGKSRCTDLGGLYRQMPKTAILCIIGAASICAVPLFSGFVSKSMIMDAVLQGEHEWVWYGLLLAAAASLHYVGIKVPYFAFFGYKPLSLLMTPIKEPPTSMLLAMLLAASMCLFVGIFPQQLFAILPYHTEYDPFHAGHVLAQVQLLLFSALAFIWLYQRGLYPIATAGVILDCDWLYRVPGKQLLLNMLNAGNSVSTIMARLATNAGKLLPTGKTVKSRDNGKFIIMVVALLLLLVLYLLPIPSW